VIDGYLCAVAVLVFLVTEPFGSHGYHFGCAECRSRAAFQVAVRRLLFAAELMLFLCRRRVPAV
jgi:hypothetical protein